MRNCLLLALLVLFPLEGKGIGSFERSEPYAHPTTRTRNIDPRVLAQCFMQVADRFPNARQTAGPVLGQRYANTWRMSSYGRQTCAMNRGDFFNYLAAFPDRRCDFATGQELPLRNWVLAQPENSVDPVRIFQQSLELNQGNVFNSILTIHQLLRNEARWRSRQFYDYQSSSEQERAFWNRFIDIRGDLSERGPRFRGDHQGSWYRIWGIMLHRLIETEARPELAGRAEECLANPSNIGSRALQNMRSFGTALGAEVYKWIYSIPETDSFGKIRLNQTGATVGGYLSAWGANSPVLLRSRRLSPNCSNQEYFVNPLDF